MSRVPISRFVMPVTSSSITSSSVRVSVRHIRSTWPRSTPTVAARCPYPNAAVSGRRGMCVKAIVISGGSWSRGEDTAHDAGPRSKARHLLVNPTRGPPIDACSAGRTGPENVAGRAATGSVRADVRGRFARDPAARWRPAAQLGCAGTGDRATAAHPPRVAGPAVRGTGLHRRPDRRAVGRDRGYGHAAQPARQRLEPAEIPGRSRGGAHDARLGVRARPRPGLGRRAAFRADRGERTRRRSAAASPEPVSTSCVERWRSGAATRWRI